MIFFYGFLSIICQSILFRELSLLFLENEILVGVLLFFWFLGAGLGSFFFTRLEHVYKTHFLPLLLFFAIFFLLGVIILIRAIYPHFQVQAFPDLFNIFILCFCFIFPVSCLQGLLFSACTAQTGYKSFSMIYLLESLGATLGGLLFTFLFLARFDAILVLLFCLAISAFFSCRKSWQLGVLCLISAFLLLVNNQIITFSRSLQWKNQPLLFAKESPYGLFALTDNSGQKDLYYNGKNILTLAPSNFQEELAHLPSLFHATPKNILYIGLPSPMLINTYLNENADTFTFVFKDVAIKEIVDRYFEIQKKDRLRFSNTDPMDFFTEQKYDLIIVDKQLPTTISLGRYFGSNFYNKISTLMHAYALAVIPIEYEENRPDVFTLRSLGRINANIKNTFPNVLLFPGLKLNFVASNGFSPLLPSAPSHGPQSALINQGYLDHYFSAERLMRFNKEISAFTPAEHEKTFGLDLFSSQIKKWLDTYLGKSFALVIFLIILFIWPLKKSAAALASDKSLTAFYLGLLSITGEIELFYFYQILAGDLYYYYSFLISLFMAGLAIGCLLSFYYKTSPVRHLGLLLLLNLWFLIIALIPLLDLSAPSFLAAKLFIFALMFSGGLIAGLLFNLLTQDFGNMPTGPQKAAAIYSPDLLGSALGSFLTVFIVAPLTGIFIGNLLIIILFFIFLLSWKKDEIEHMAKN